MTSRHALIRPCPKCPFRTDIETYLRAERASEIAQSIARGAEFPCHQTTVHEEDDDGTEHLVDDPRSSKVCAGSLIVLEKEGKPNQMMRISQQFGDYDPSRLDMDSPVYGSLLAWVEAHLEEGETCDVVGPDCEAPAGYMVGGSVVPGTEFVDEQCSECGLNICSACQEDGVCTDCIENRAEEEAV